MKNSAFALASLIAFAVSAQEEPRQTLGSWRLSAGANFGFGLKAKMSYAAPSSFYATPTAADMGSAADIGRRLASGEGVRFLNGAYIAPDEAMQAPYTQNWRFPVSGLDRDTGRLSFETAQLDPGGVTAAGSDDSGANGASIELSRTLFADERGFGLDLAIGVSYLRARNFFRMRGGGRYLGRTKYVYTPTPGSMNANVLTSSFLSPSDGYYGSGGAEGIGAVLDWSDFGEDTISSSSEHYSYNVDASGDYEEWELSLMLKPWYEVTDWFLVDATVGVGLTRSEFEYSTAAAIDGAGIYSSHGSEDEWRLYGLAGAGVLFRAWSFDVSCDILARIGQRDMDVSGGPLRGKIEKPDFIVRLAVGFEF